MKILWISTQYPYGNKRTKGIFIKRTIDYLSNNLLKFHFHTWVPYSSYFPIISILNHFSSFKSVLKEWRNSFPNESDKAINKLTFIRYFRLPRLFFQHTEGYLFCLTNFSRLKSKFDYKLIHANWLTPEGNIAMILSKAFHVPYIVTMHGTDVTKCNSNMRLKKVTQKVLDNAERVTGTRYIFEMAKEVGLIIDENKIRITHCILDADVFTIYNKKPLKKQLGYSEDSKIIFFAGALRPVKNIDSLIKACSLIKLDGIKLIIAGSGNELSNLKAISRKYELENKITFIGVLNTNEMIAYYNACDVFCLPSHSEGFGNVVFEALLCGSPVAASNLGEISNNIKEGYNGYLFNPNNINEIAGSLEKALTRDWDRVKLRNSVEFLFPENVIKEYENIYLDYLK